MAKASDALSGRAGCLGFGALFVLCGSLFLWMFFSRETFRVRGNPYMALFFGSACLAVGLVALFVGIRSFLPSAKETRRRQARNLPR
jgi:hypothetical protein